MVGTGAGGMTERVGLVEQSKRKEQGSPSEWGPRYSKNKRDEHRKDNDLPTREEVTVVPAD